MTSSFQATKDWKTLLADSLASPAELADNLGVSKEDIREAVVPYPARINPYALDLIRIAGAARCLLCRSM
ncbi:MAG: hypothetical protein ACOCQI_00210 [Desulfosalsimonas sp.]